MVETDGSVWNSSTLTRKREGFCMVNENVFERGMRQGGLIDRDTS
jgi:hypothetical protein